MSYGEVSSTTVAESGEIGWCSTISKMQCISEHHIREASSIDVAWLGLRPLACFLVSENGAFVAAGIGCVMRLSSCSCRLSLDVRFAVFAAAMVWVYLAVSKVVSSFSALMIWLQTSTSLVIRRCGIDCVW